MKNLLFICSIIWLISCSDSHEDSITSVTDGLPVASLLEDSPRTFSLWTDLLKRADLYNAMNLDVDYTAFKLRLRIYFVRLNRMVFYQ
ncbi:hypothetical protein EZS27_032489 [termite gut metagenome]|uniref:Uncharacterized protein n=1 Tax=termite gut metagenome TaxID=433724 RepID=A0A5J4Q5T9_9ZZZZ